METNYPNANYQQANGFPYNGQPANVTPPPPQKKKFYKKWWFWVIIVVLIIGIVGAGGSGSKDNEPSTSTKPGVTEQAPEPTTEKTIEYNSYDVTELFDQLKQNALKAEETHRKEYVKIEGYLHVIDSDGKYISIGTSEDDLNYFLDDIQCFIKSDEQKQVIMELNKYDKITVYGQIKSIGEVLGYSLDIHRIEKAE